MKKKIIALLLMVAVLLTAGITAAFAADGEETSEQAETAVQTETPVKDDVPEIIEVEEDLIIDGEDYIVEEKTEVFFKGKVSILNGASFINNGKTVFESEVSVLGKLQNNGLMLVSESATATVGEKNNEEYSAELVNFGEISVAGELILENNAVFAGTNNALLCLAGGKINGTSHYMSADGEEDVYTEIGKKEFLKLCGEAEFEKDVKYILTENVTVPQNDVINFTAGDVTVCDGVEVTVNGALMMTGGILRFESGSKLANNFFISVSKEAQLCLESGAEYVPSDTSAVVWNQESGHSIISGIDRKWIDCSVYAASAAVLRQSLGTQNYHTLTVYISDPLFMESVTSVPEGTVISLK